VRDTIQILGFSVVFRFNKKHSYRLFNSELGALSVLLKKYNAFCVTSPSGEDRVMPIA